MNKIMKHLGDRYEVLSGYETVELIHKALKEVDHVGLSYEQKQNLKIAFGNSGILGNLDMPFLAYSWKENKEVSKNPIWRLSYPFFVIYVILLLAVFCPIKWIFTGTYSLQKGKLGEFNLKWYNKIFDRRW